MSAACVQSSFRLNLLPWVGPQTLLVHTEWNTSGKIPDGIQPTTNHFLFVCLLRNCESVFFFFKETTILILTMCRRLCPVGSIHRMMISSLSLSLSLSPSHNDTQTDTRSVPIGRTVARERCLLNVDRICCLVHFRHENNCRIWIFIARRLFMWRLYSSNISKRGRSASCTPPPPLSILWILHQIPNHRCPLSFFSCRC